MKLEPIVGIAQLVKPFLKAKIIFYTILMLALAFWVALLFPQLFTLLGLGAWRTSNVSLIGWGVIATSVLLLVALLVNLDKWISSRLRTRQEKRQFYNLLNGLSQRELVYLFQYIRHNTLLIEFDETDPVVGLLSGKGLIYPSVRAHIGSVVSYNSSYHHGQTFEMLPELHSYLTSHLEIFGKLSQKS